MLLGRHCSLIASSGLCLLLAAAPVSAQTVVDERLWLAPSIQERQGTDSPWRWALETQQRTRDGVNELDVLTVRPMIGYDLTSRSSVWAGYSATATFLPAGGARMEHRITEQYTFTARPWGGTLSTRFRLEQRFLEGDSELAWRARDILRYSRPFSSGSRTSWVVADELFVHLKSTTLTTSGLDQNRVFLGLSRSTKAGHRLEGGYLNQFTNGHRLPNRRNHIFQLVLSFVL